MTEIVLRNANGVTGSVSPRYSSRVDADVALEVASHEALIRQAYKDSVGVWTWCVGMTNATGHNVERYIDRPADLQHCMDLYAWALTRYADQVETAFAGVTISKAQFAAALSFHWNTGGIGRAAWVKHFRAGNVAAARTAFMAWNKPPEIVGRRGKERDLFFDGKWSNNGTMTEYTRLTSRYTPVWSSGIRINVGAELRRAFGAPTAPVIDLTPKPDSKPAAPTLTVPGDLRKGAKGGDVRLLQTRLNEKGASPALRVDGDFGDKTDAAVRDFQRRRGLKVDGWVGPATWGALLD